MPYILIPTDICLREKTMFLFYSCLEPIVHILMSFHRVNSFHSWWTAKASTPMGYCIGLERSFGQWNCIKIEWFNLLCSGHYKLVSFIMNHITGPIQLFFSDLSHVRWSSWLWAAWMDWVRIGRVIHSIFLLKQLRTHMIGEEQIRNI